MSFPKKLQPRRPAAKVPDRPRRRRWLLRCALVVLIVGGLLAGGYAYYHHRVTADLAACLAELDHKEPGWRLRDLEAARTAIPDAENSALCVSKAGREIAKVRGARKAREAGTLIGLPQSAPSWDQGSLSSRPQQLLSAEKLAQLRKDLAEQSAALDAASSLADLPNGRWAVDYSRPITVIESDYSQHEAARDVAVLFHTAALVQMQDGDLKAAARSCRAFLNAARSLGDESLWHVQVTRGGLVGIACQDVERLLNQGELTLDDLADLQKRLEEERSYPRLLVMMRAARAETHEILDDIESGTSQGVIPPASFFEALAEPLALDAIRANHPRVLQKLTRAVEIAGLPVVIREGQMHALQAEIDAEFRDNPIRFAFYRLDVEERDCRELDARLNCLIAALAVERYRREHDGKWPKVLVFVVPELLLALPEDPADASELGFCRLADRVVIYSRLATTAGERFNPDQPSPPGVGIAVHLFDVKERHQPPR